MRNLFITWKRSSGIIKYNMKLTAQDVDQPIALLPGCCYTQAYHIEAVSDEHGVMQNLCCCYLYNDDLFPGFAFGGQNFECSYLQVTFGVA